MRRSSWSMAALTAGALVTCACAAPSSGPGEAGRSSSADGRTMVLASSAEDETLDPLAGYGEDGATKIFDGLVMRDADLRLQPALATALPEPDADGTAWRVTLRDGVTFHDGSSFGPEDVVATYTALLDPATASPLVTSFGMLERVERTGEREVVFHLRHPYAPFPQKLVLGIVPSEAVRPGVPVTESGFGSAPVGTGPYRLAEWRKGDRMVLVANPDYWDGAPAVETVRIVVAADDNTRAQRLQAGEFDGTVLPPRLAGTFEDLEGYSVVSHASADYRAVTLPSGNPVTADPAVRRALNLAVDREGMIRAILGGRGKPAHTPIPQALRQFAAPEATFPHDPGQAERLLDEAGWTRHGDGVRSKDGTPLRFTLMYPASDTVRRDFAVAFASDAAGIGAEVRLEGLGWDAIEPRMGQDALVLGGGNVFDPDLVAYPLLHSSFSADGYNNPGSYANDAVDAALDEGRRSLDEDVRAAAYRRLQRDYVDAPGFVFLAFLDHTYVVRDRWTGYQEIVEPHVHGVTWGPWWNLQDWRPAS
jgi:peptide/nickel transport system substrate-binding protein